MAGTVIPQVVTEDRASGAQFIDGSLLFSGEVPTSGPQYLIKTLGSGNRKTFTMSYWLKIDSNTGENRRYISTGYGVGGNTYGFYIGDNSTTITFNDTGSNAADYSVRPSASMRDNGWYHLVYVLDTTQSDDDSKVRIYINGVQQSSFGTNTRPSLNADGNMNKSGNELTIGCWKLGANYTSGLVGQIAQFYHVDGQALGPGYFGFTDPLTGTWRPKKFRAEGTTVNDGKTWSSYINGSILSGFAAANAFDGSAGIADGDCCSPANNSTLSWIPPQTIRGEKIEAFFRYNQNNSSGVAAQVFQNGVDITSTVSAVVPNDNNGDYVTLPFKTIDNVNGLSWTRTANGYKDYRLAAIRVDGVIMVDSTTQNLDFGTNGFYLPFDGNNHIGEDQSGKGNDFTLKNFGGSTIPEKATGAKPILNSLGGSVPGLGVFGSKENRYYKTTSASNSGGKYVFEGQGTQPKFNFVRGATYTFNWSASSSHPLRFATQADAAGSSEYTNGTSVSGNVTTITVPHNAPDTLYYYCNVHNGMGNSISVITDETKADPYAWKCTVAMPLLDYANGTRADFSHDLNCTTNHKSTDYDSISAFSSPGDMFYDKVTKFEGTGSGGNDRVRIPTGSFAMGTGDFTIEFWAHFTATGDQGNRNARILTPQSESGNYLQFLSSTSTSNIQFKYNGGGNSDIAIPSIECINRTRHYVYQRTGTTGQLIVDGVLYDTGTDNLNYPDVAYQIGRYDTNNGGLSAWMADLRVYTGIQKYSTTGKSIGDQIFIPASSNPNIISDSPSGVTTQTKTTKVTNGGIAVNRPENQYIDCPASSDFRLDGQYCIEYFMKLEQYDADGPYVRTFVHDGATGDGGSTNIHLNINPSSGAMLLWNGSSELIGAQLHVTGNWHHICLTRDSSNKTRLFVDGRLSGSATINTDYDLNSGSPRPRLGALGTTGGTSGNYSNWRIIKGSIPTEYQTSTTTLFDRAFYPPTEPLTETSQGATANDVKLIACQSPTSATASTKIPSGTLAAGYSAPPSNFNPFNNDINSVQGKEGGFAKLNQLNTAADLSRSGYAFYFAARADWKTVTGTIPIRTPQGNIDDRVAGKFYWEMTVGSVPTTNSGNVGVGLRDAKTAGRFKAQELGYNDGGRVYLANGHIRGGGTSNTTAWGASYGTGDTIGVAFDAYNGTLEYYKNGRQQGGGAAFSNLNNGYVADWVPAFGVYTGGSQVDTNSEFHVNFGQRPFKYPPPDGFSILSSTELRPEKVLANPTQYVGVTTYVGNSSSGSQKIRTGIKPDLVWIKERTVQQHHMLFDTVRGPQKRLIPNEPDTESNDSSSLTSFNVDGFTVANGNEVNQNNQDFVAWTWKAGGSNGTFNKDDAGYANAGQVGVSSGYYNNILYVMDDVYSSRISGSIQYGQAVNLFDGKITSSVIPQDNGTLTWTPQSAITGTIRIRMEKSGNNLIINGTNVNAPNNTSGHWYTYSGNSITSIQWGRTNSASQVQLIAIEVNGKMLRDSNLGSVPSLAATGASIGTKQGFSMIKFTGNETAGSTIPHGLTKKPDFIIIKSIDQSEIWTVFHRSVGWYKYLRLNTNDNATTGSTVWNNIEPDDKFTTLGTFSGVNRAGTNFMAYTWHNVEGMQKFGQFYGNNSTNGVYVELGFRPAVIWIKRYDDTSYNWNCWDNTRSPINPSNEVIRLNLNNVEEENYNSGNLDILSNGFKIRGTWANINADNKHYVYCAWADQPTFNSYGAQSNAR